MKETPIAVISGASRGALRRRRYAMRSIARVERRRRTPSPTNSVSSNATRGDEPGLRAVEAEWVPATVTLNIVPHMNTSPWAKLISSMMP